MVDYIERCCEEDFDYRLLLMIDMRSISPSLSRFLEGVSQQCARRVPQT